MHNLELFLPNKLSALPHSCSVIKSINPNNTKK
nr:MAG TPA: hypothetical protein [Caudoviricetes sp.]